MRGTLSTTMEKQKEQGRNTKSTGKQRLKWQ